MCKSLLERDRLHEPVSFRMGKRFINIVERQVVALLLIVMMDCLQTGDVAQERGSCQATEDDHRVAVLEFFPQRETASLGVEHADIGNEAAHLGHVLTTTSTSAPTVLSQDHRLQGTGHQQENRNLESHHHLQQEVIVNLPR